jgi:polysaccharide export outer membrane protein
MKRYHQFILFLPLFLILSCSANKPAEKIVVSQKDIGSPTPFVLGQSDEIIFNVWRHDELQRTVQIDPSGNLYLPLVGEVKASGLTIPQLRKKICLRLSKYIVNPQVDISVSRLKSQKIHILGEVNSPGSFPLDRRMLVWEAISQAKGFTTDANKENVLLVRSEDGFARITALNLDIQKMLKKGGPKQDFSLRNGDLIYVPPSTIANVERFMLRLKNIISPITEFERGIIMSQDVVNVLKGKDIKGGIVY